jgi:hypothetical protein
MLDRTRLAEVRQAIPVAYSEFIGRAAIKLPAVTA